MLLRYMTATAKEVIVLRDKVFYCFCYKYYGVSIPRFSCHTLAPTAIEILNSVQVAISPTNFTINDVLSISIWA